MRGRHDHAAEGGDDRQCRLTRVAQFALGELALDLQTDDEEEQHHRQVVHPLAQVELDDVVVQFDPGLEVPEIEVALGPGRVGPDQGDHGRPHQQQPGACFLVQEVAQRPDETSRFAGWVAGVPVGAGIG